MNTKKHLFTIFIFIHFFGIITAQSYRITYVEVLQLDASNLESIPESLQEDYKKEVNKGISAILTYHNGESNYVHEKGKEIMVTSTEVEGSTTHIQVVSPMNSLVDAYKNQSENEQISVINFDGQKFKVSEELKPLDWEITGDIKKINAYTCRKAETIKGSNIVYAWFTDEIPINEGPETYWGLPGLILEIQINKKIITATKIEELDYVPEIKELEGKDSSFEEYRAYMMDIVNGGVRRSSDTKNMGNSTITTTTETKFKPTKKKN